MSLDNTESISGIKASLASLLIRLHLIDITNLHLTRSWLLIEPGKVSVFIAISMIVVIALVDTSIIRIYIFTGGLHSYTQNIAIFSVMVLTFAIGQYLILKFAGLRSTQTKHPQLTLIHKSVSIAQYVLIAILVTIILQMTFTSSYSINLLKAIVWISYLTSFILLGLLAQRFFSWYKSNRNSVVIAYAVAMAMLSLNAAFTIVYVTDQLAELAGLPEVEYIRPLKSPVSAVSGHHDNTINSIYIVISGLSFVSIWSATVLLLHHYSRKLGRVKYWVMVSIPLIYFLSQFQPFLLNILAPLRLSDPILFSIVYTLIFSATKPVGGILFGIAFWSIAKNIDHRAVKDYMIVSAYGFVLLFTSNQPVGLTLAAYPPFGVTTVSFLALASYLMLVGIYSSALSVANDVELRKLIRKTLQTQSDLLDNIGSAQMESQIQNRVFTVSKNLSEKIAIDTGIQSSLEEKEIKDYLQRVLEEIRSTKKKPESV